MRVAPSPSLGAAVPVLMATEQTAPGDCIQPSVRLSVHPSVHRGGASGDVDAPRGAPSTPSTTEEPVFCPKKAALAESHEELAGVRAPEKDLPQLG